MSAASFPGRQARLVRHVVPGDPGGLEAVLHSDLTYDRNRILPGLLSFSTSNAVPQSGSRTGEWSDQVSKIRHPERTGLHVRVVLEGGVAVGPGRAELLEGIAELGSIASAARAMGMSYRRAWLLLDETAKAFGAPVVVASPGGVQGGRANVTELGAALVEIYRAIEDKAAQSVSAEVAALRLLMKD